MRIGTCNRCGAPCPSGGNSDFSSCPSCPAVTCQDCGGSDDRKCACWTDITQLSIADTKALFAGCDCVDVDLSVDPVIS